MLGRGDRAGEERAEEGEAAQSNLEELVSAAEEFDRSEGGTLADWLIQVSLVSDVDRFEGADPQGQSAAVGGAGGGAVSLMTLHAAKGLEFPVVFIAGCEDGLLPFRREASAFEEPDDTRQEEERRLAFVGMTRSKEELTLTHARRRMLRGRTTPQACSPFLAEIGQEGVRVEDLTTPEPPAPPGSRWPDHAGPRRRFAGGFYEDVADRAAIEAQADRAVARAESESHRAFPPEYEYLKVGSRVRHPQFGPGRVVALRQPWPQTRAEIVFEAWGRKTIVLSAAQLEVGEDQAPLGGRE